MTISFENRVKSSAVSGVLEIIATHPLDYGKTLLQSNTKNITFKEFISNPYKGFGSRIIGIVPMRILFWNSINYFKEIGYNPILAGLCTAVVQTSVDYPIEQIKIQRMIHNNHSILAAFTQPNLLKGYTLTLSRNIGFAVLLNCCIDGHDGSYYHGALGGFIGSVITHPIDSLKTWYQAGNVNYPRHWTLSNYCQGWHLRAGISLISMNIGWIVFSRMQIYYQSQSQDTDRVPIKY